MGTIDAVAVEAPRLSIPVGLPASHVAAVVLGNALQFYDFLTYAFFATQIGRTFFPSHDASTSLLASLATFGAGFLTRPIGAVVIGRMGDTIGRKPAMVLSFALMGVAIVGLSLTPSYAAIGVAAPIVAIVFRLMQGFALGGEVGPSTAYLIEAAPPHRRGFYVSLQYMTQDAAVLAAGLIGLALASLLGAQALDQWGWRIAFLVGAAIVPFGLVMRRRLAETLREGAALASDAQPAGLKGYAPIAILGLAMLTGGTIVNYGLAYLTTYAGSTLHMPANVAFTATITIGACGILFDVAGGALSDRFGRKVVMIAPWAFLLVAILPGFWLMAHFRSAAALIGVSAMLQIPLSVAAAAALVSITESLPRRVRSGALAMLYAAAISVFGGTTQVLITWLIRLTRDPLAPAWYMTGAVGVALIAMLMMRETAPGAARPTLKDLLLAQAPRGDLGTSTRGHGWAETRGGRLDRVYLLDTNVISELRRERPHGAVLAWLGGVDAADLHICAVTVGEIKAGVEITRGTDAGKAAEIESWLDRVIDTHAVIPIDASAFRLWAKLMHRRSDKLIEDTLIAAVALTHNLTVVTRNTRDFEPHGVATLGPFAIKR